jgi:hypothetical protein
MLLALGAEGGLNVVVGSEHGLLCTTGIDVRSPILTLEI